MRNFTGNYPLYMLTTPVIESHLKSTSPSWQGIGTRVQKIHGLNSITLLDYEVCIRYTSNANKAMTFHGKMVGLSPS